VKPFALDPDNVSPARVLRTILCQDIVGVGDAGRVRLAKGRIVREEDIPVLRTAGAELHLLELEPGDVHEDDASIRLAHAVAGEGLDIRPPVESQSHLRAAYRGLVEVRTGPLEEINRLPDISVFTLFDGQPVREGKAVAATKVTPLAVPEELLAQAESIALRTRPLVSVRPFLGSTVGVIVRERLTDKARDRFETAIHMKVRWFGSPAPTICYLPDSADAIARAIADLVDDGVAVVLAAGVNSTDPLDLTIQALDRLGAVTERRGVPAHPGSTCWLSYLGDVPIFGLALCGMFSQTTVLDLLLPRFLAGRQVRAADIAALGHGGVLGKEMAFRFPDYGE
jgi:hypothetical protein